MRRPPLDARLVALALLASTLAAGAARADAEPHAPVRAPIAPAASLERSYNPSPLADIPDSTIDLALGAQQIVDEGSSAPAAAAMEAAAMSIPRPGSSNLVEASFATILAGEGLQPSAALALSPLQVLATERAHARFQQTLVKRAAYSAFRAAIQVPNERSGYGDQLGRSLQISLASTGATSRFDDFSALRNRTAIGVGFSLFDSSWVDDAASCAFSAADAADALDRLTKSVRQDVLAQNPQADATAFKAGFRQAHAEGRLRRVEGMAEYAYQYGLMLLLAQGTGERAAVLSEFFRERMKFCVTRPYRFIIAVGATTSFRIERGDRFSFDRALGSLSVDLGSTITEASGWGWGLTGFFRGGYAIGTQPKTGELSNVGVYHGGLRVSLPSRWFSVAAELLRQRDWFLDSGDTSRPALRWGMHGGVAVTLPIAFGFSATGAFRVRGLAKTRFDQEQIGFVALNWRRGPNHERAALRTFRREQE